MPDTQTEPTQEELVAIARERYEALHAAENTLRDSLKPTLILEARPETDEDNAYLLIRCPGCGHEEEHAEGDIYDTDLRDVDLSERWTAPDSLNLESKVAEFDYDGREDYYGVTLLMTCCYTPVSLPEGWTTGVAWLRQGQR